MRDQPDSIGPPDAANGAPGKLYLVGTPIGNLEDITFRALRTLKEVDLIACEDTRRTQKLLSHYSIHTHTISYHEHNELTRAPELIIELEQGSHIALVSDAGMPVISDPGYRLVKLAIRHAIQVIPIPGASAFVAALAAAGLPVDKFRFLGFLPARKLARQKALKEIKDSPKTLVFYESPQRVVETLMDVSRILGEPDVVVAREVTKVYEEFMRGAASQVAERLKKKTVKGEITVLVGPPNTLANGKGAGFGGLHDELERVMQQRGIDERAALKVVARSLGISKSEAYRQLQAGKGKG